MENKDIKKIFSENLKKYLSKKEKTQLELANFLGVSNTTVNNYVKGYNTPRMDKIDGICKFLNITRNDLMSENVEHEEIGNKMPVFSAVSAGYPLLTNDEIVDFEEISEEIRTKGEYFGLKIKGSSMEPRYLEGDTLIVRQQSDVDNGDLAIVLINGDEATFKKVEKSSNGLMLIPLNPSYSPKFFTCEDIERLPVQIIGKVVELRGKL